VKKTKQQGNKLNTNYRIKARRVILIDDEGTRRGEFLRDDAINLAKDKELDLVEVTPNKEVPICKMMDYGKHLYKQKKTKKKIAEVKTKEVKVRPLTDIHDLEVKKKNARKFITQGHRVKVTMRFKGREHAHHDIGAKKCLEIAEALSDIATIDSQPKLTGRDMSMMLVRKIEK